MTAAFCSDVKSRFGFLFLHIDIVFTQHLLHIVLYSLSLFHIEIMDVLADA